MSTFCMSDIHGQYAAFMQMLDDIALTDDDHVYVLGDVIDRGPDVASLLVACVELDRTDNFHFLLGNHEHMAYQYLLESSRFANDLERKHWLEKVEGSEKTIEALDELDRDWVDAELIPWFKELAYYDIVRIGQQDWMLVHAGFDPDRYGDTGRRAADDIVIDKRFGAQSLSDLLWIREDWIEDGRDAPLPVVHGHTPTDAYQGAALEALDAKIGEKAYRSKGGVLYYRNKVDIDCGAGGGLNLGCLRLDDLEEFHVDV